jgi:hypothetical protein
MANTFASVLLNLLLITLVGGIFVHRLQHRNWIRQQRIGSQEKLIIELKVLFAELDALLSKRLYRERRLLWALRRANEEGLKTALAQYDEVIQDWNEKRNSFQIRLVRVVSVSLAQEFEDHISRKLISIGGELERQTRNALTNNRKRGWQNSLTDLEIELKTLSRSVYEFLRTIYARLQREQDELYAVDKFQRMPQTEHELGYVSSWFLLKTLFIPLPQSRE